MPDEHEMNAWEHAQSRGEDVAAIFAAMDAGKMVKDGEYEEDPEVSLDTYALDVSIEYVGTVLLSFQGPTERLTATMASASMEGDNERVSRVTYSHSWSSGSGEVTLPEDHPLTRLFDYYSMP